MKNLLRGRVGMVVAVALCAAACEPPTLFEADCGAGCEDALFVEVRDSAGELVDGVSGRATFHGRQVSFDCRGAQMASELHECVPGGVMLRGAPGGVRLEIFNADGSLMKVGDLMPSYSEQAVEQPDSCELPPQTCRQALVSISGIDYPSSPMRWALLEDHALGSAPERGSLLDAVALIKADGGVFFAGEAAVLAEDVVCVQSRTEACEIKRALGAPDAVKEVDVPMLCPGDAEVSGLVTLAGRSLAVSFVGGGGEPVDIEPGDRLTLLGVSGLDCEGGEVPFKVGVSVSTSVEGPFSEVGVATSEAPSVTVRDLP